MEQIGLGAMLMQGQVTNVSTGYTSLSRDTKQTSAQTFDRELDKAKKVNSKPQEKRQQPQIEKEQSKEVSIRNEEKVKKDKSVSQESEKTEADVEIGSDEIQNEVDEKILLLLSTTLNVTVEQLENLLNQMGYKASDMLEQQNFSQLIGKVYGEIKGEDLLTMETGAKPISELFEKVQLISDEAAIQNPVLSVQKSIHNEISTSDIVKPMKQPVSLLQEQPQTTSTIVGDVGSSEMSAYSKQVSKAKDIGESSSVLNGIVINNTEKEGLGMVIPIQNFSSTVSSQLWKPVGEMSVPIPQMIETNIIDQIDFKALGITKEVHLQLSPKELGELSIKLIEENSTIVAHIKVDNEKTKVFLLNQLSDLKTALEERGLTVVDVKVDINQDTHSSQMEQEKQKSSKRIQEIIARHLEVLEQDEEEMSTQISDSEVDYMV